jgi:hypothetical protein
VRLLLIEIASFASIPTVWYLFRRFARREVLGDMAAGALIGCFIEFATEPLWTYHFRVTVYKDAPLAVVLGWGVMFTLVTFVSEKLYRLVLRKAAVAAYDKRIFLFDLAGAVLVGLPLEALGVKSGIWDYNHGVLQWNWGTLPVIDMPVEALVGYALLMLVGPTFIRYWSGAFEGRPGTL